MLCIYHVADHDGKGSAGIVNNIYPGVECYGYNHDMEPPYDLIEKHDDIVVCDICLPMDLMFEINDKKSLVWIDHHISVIKEYDEMMATGKYKEIKGIRKVGTAAIELTWNYFYPTKEIPLGIKLLALNDIFDLRDKRVRPFEYAIQSMGINRPQEQIWKDLIEDKIDIEKTVEKGDAILSWIKIRNHRMAYGMVFESSFNGMTCICANMPQGYSEFFDSVPDLHKYDFMVNFYMDKNNLWKMTMYTDKDYIDVSKIVELFGGGGHRAAAGASGLYELPDFLKQSITI